MATYKCKMIFLKITMIQRFLCLIETFCCKLGKQFGGLAAFVPLRTLTVTQIGTIF